MEPNDPAEPEEGTKKLSKHEREFWHKQLPPGFQNHMERIARVVMRGQPRDIYEFVARFTEEQLVKRNAELWSLPTESYFVKLHRKNSSQALTWNPRRRPLPGTTLSTGIFPAFKGLQPDFLATEFVPFSGLTESTGEADNYQEGAGVAGLAASDTDKRDIPGKYDLPSHIDGGCCREASFVTDEKEAVLESSMYLAAMADCVNDDDLAEKGGALSGHAMDASQTTSDVVQREMRNNITEEQIFHGGEFSCPHRQSGDDSKAVLALSSDVLYFDPIEQALSDIHNKPAANAAAKSTSGCHDSQCHGREEKPACIEGCTPHCTSAAAVEEAADAFPVSDDSTDEEGVDEERGRGNLVGRPKEEDGKRLSERVRAKWQMVVRDALQVSADFPMNDNGVQCQKSRAIPNKNKRTNVIEEEREITANIESSHVLVHRKDLVSSDENDPDNQDMLVRVGLNRRETDDRRRQEGSNVDLTDCFGDEDSTSVDGMAGPPWQLACAGNGNSMSKMAGQISGLEMIRSVYFSPLASSHVLSRAACRVESSVDGEDILDPRVDDEKSHQDNSHSGKVVSCRENSRREDSCTDKCVSSESNEPDDSISLSNDDKTSVLTRPIVADVQKPNTEWHGNVPTTNQEAVSLERLETLRPETDQLPPGGTSEADNSFSDVMENDNTVEIETAPKETSFDQRAGLEEESTENEVKLNVVAEHILCFEAKSLPVGMGSIRLEHHDQNGAEHQLQQSILSKASAFSDELTANSEARQKLALTERASPCQKGLNAATYTRHGMVKPEISGDGIRTAKLSESDERFSSSNSSEQELSEEDSYSTEVMASQPCRDSTRLTDTGELDCEAREAADAANDVDNDKVEDDFVEESRALDNIKAVENKMQCLMINDDTNSLFATKSKESWDEGDKDIPCDDDSRCHESYAILKDKAENVTAMSILLNPKRCDFETDHCLAEPNERLCSDVNNDDNYDDKENVIVQEIPTEESKEDDEEIATDFPTEKESSFDKDTAEDNNVCQDKEDDEERAKDNEMVCDKVPTDTAETSDISTIIDSLALLDCTQKKDAIVKAKSFVREYTSKLEKISSDVEVILSSYRTMMNNPEANEHDISIDDNVEANTEVKTEPAEVDRAHVVCKTAAEVDSVMHQFIKTFIRKEKGDKVENQTYDCSISLRDNRIGIEITRSCNDPNNLDEEARSPNVPLEELPGRKKLLEEIHSYKGKGKVTAGDVDQDDIRSTQETGSAGENEHTYRFRFSDNDEKPESENLKSTHSSSADRNENNNGLHHSRSTSALSLQGLGKPKTSPDYRDNVQVYNNGDRVQIGRPDPKYKHQGTIRTITLTRSNPKAGSNKQPHGKAGSGKIPFISKAQIHSSHAHLKKDKPQGVHGKREKVSVCAAGEGMPTKKTGKTDKDESDDKREKSMVKSGRKNSVPRSSLTSDYYENRKAVKHEHAGSYTEHKNVGTTSSSKNKERKPVSEQQKIEKTSQNKETANEYVHLPQMEDFPLRLLVVNEDDDRHVPEVTRRISMETPSENTLIQTFVTQTNTFTEPREFELSSRRHRWYPDEKSDFFGTDDSSRKLILEYDCIASHKDSSQRLDLENGTLWLSQAHSKEKGKVDEKGKIGAAFDPITEKKFWSASGTLRNAIQFRGSTLVIDGTESHATGGDLKSELHRTDGGNNSIVLHGNRLIGLGDMFERIGGSIERQNRDNRTEGNTNGNNVWVKRPTTKEPCSYEALLGDCCWNDHLVDDNRTNIFVRQSKSTFDFNRSENFVTTIGLQVYCYCPEACCSETGDCNNNSEELVDIHAESDDATLQEIEQITWETSNPQPNQQPTRLRRNDVTNGDPELTLTRARSVDREEPEYGNKTMDRNETPQFANRTMSNVKPKSGFTRFSLPKDSDGESDTYTISETCVPPPPIPVEGDKVVKEDITTQVVATDIGVVDVRQTGDSLAIRDPRLPRRSSTRLKFIRPSLRRYLSDCGERPKADENQSITLKESGTQACSDIYTSRDVQTGSSLMYDGPVCKWDYKLRKIKHAEKDMYRDCSTCPVEYSSRTDYSSLNACDRQTQVTITQINIDESLQTGQSLLLRESAVGESVRQAKARILKSKQLEDCECPKLEEDKKSIVQTELQTQNDPFDICTNDMTQTGHSLSWTASKERDISYHRTVEENHQRNLTPFDDNDSNNFLYQVKSKGIGNFHETQSKDTSDSNETQSKDISDFHETQSKDISDFHETQSKAINDFKETQCTDISDFQETESKDIGDFHETQSKNIVKLYETLLKDIRDVNETQINDSMALTKGFTRLSPNGLWNADSVIKRFPCGNIDDESYTSSQNIKRPGSMQSLSTQVTAFDIGANDQAQTSDSFLLMSPLIKRSKLSVEGKIVTACAPTVSERALLDESKSVQMGTHLSPKDAEKTLARPESRPDCIPGDTDQWNSIPHYPESLQGHAINNRSAYDSAKLLPTSCYDSVETTAHLYQPKEASDDTSHELCADVCSTMDPLLRCTTSCRSNEFAQSFSPQLDAVDRAQEYNNMKSVYDCVGAMAMKSGTPRFDDDSVCTFNDYTCTVKDDTSAIVSEIPYQYKTSMKTLIRQCKKLSFAAQTEPERSFISVGVKTPALECSRRTKLIRNETCQTSELTEIETSSPKKQQKHQCPPYNQRNASVMSPKDACAKSTVDCHNVSAPSIHGSRFFDFRGEENDNGKSKQQSVPMSHRPKLVRWVGLDEDVDSDKELAERKTLDTKESHTKTTNVISTTAITGASETCDCNGRHRISKTRCANKAHYLKPDGIKSIMLNRKVQEDFTAKTNSSIDGERRQNVNKDLPTPNDRLILNKTAASINENGTKPKLEINLRTNGLLRNAFIQLSEKRPAYNDYTATMTPNMKKTSKKANKTPVPQPFTTVTIKTKDNRAPSQQISNQRQKESGHCTTSLPEKTKEKCQVHAKELEHMPSKKTFSSRPTVGTLKGKHQRKTTPKVIQKAKPTIGNRTVSARTAATRSKEERHPTKPDGVKTRSSSSRFPTNVAMLQRVALDESQPQEMDCDDEVAACKENEAGHVPYRKKHTTNSGPSIALQTYRALRFAEFPSHFPNRHRLLR